MDGADKPDVLPPSDRALEIENRDLKAENDRLRKKIADEELEEERDLGAHDDEPDDEEEPVDEESMEDLA